MLPSPPEVAAFQSGLRDSGGYRTDASRPGSLGDRLFGGLDAWFYLRLAGLIRDGNKLALRGGFTELDWAAHSLAFLRLIEGVGGRVEVSGLENRLRAGRPVVYVGNHMSGLESFLLPGWLLPFDRVAAVIKESLLRYPVLGAFARATEPISVGRVNPREDLRAVLTQGAAFLAQGRSVVLFPTATRSALFDEASFNTLGVKLARNAGAPVIPLALKTDFQANGSLVKDIGALDRSKAIRFAFGEPLSVSGDGKDANRRAAAFIRSRLDAWG